MAWKISGWAESEADDAAMSAELQEALLQLTEEIVMQEG